MTDDDDDEEDVCVSDKEEEGETCRQRQTGRFQHDDVLYQVPCRRGRLNV